MTVTKKITTLALTFIMLIGFLLIFDSLGLESGFEVLDMSMEKLMVYFVMLFSVIMEMLQIRYKRNYDKWRDEHEGDED